MIRREQPHHASSDDEEIAVTIADLAAPDAHALLSRLRERAPVWWLPALDGWLVLRRDLALQVMGDAATFTVEDPRFSTGRVVGPSMLTLDGDEHQRHRAPFARPFRLQAVRERFTELVSAEVDRLIDPVEPAGEAELRRAFAGPLAATVVTHSLGLRETDTGAVLGWYDAIVAAVTEVTAGGGVPPAGRAAFADLRGAIDPVLDREVGSSLLAAAGGGAEGLERAEVVSNAAVMLFGGIETTEGMIANAVQHLLSHGDQLALVTSDPGRLPNAIEESLRLEPAAAMVDRYATADVSLGDTAIHRGELVSVSIAAANRDPATFPDPDRFDVRRENARRHLAFARGPHVCIGMHLARLEAHTAVGRLLDRLPGLHLDPARPSAPSGLVFRKPPALHVLWSTEPD
ncbi:MAG TPA: cytochrome P450 [Solirubrobacteraceae bacterium]|nr:cytochrome P450 [Solirubrobacteraceae bacterium]